MMAHILQCKHTAAQAISNRYLHDLRTLLKDLDTEPNMIKDLSKGFNAWHLNPPTPPMLTNARWLQSFISWDNFSHSFLAISWQTQQQTYYNNQQLWRSGTKWMVKLLKWVLKHAWQQWDHQNNELHKQNSSKVKDLAINQHIREQYNIGTNKITRTTHTLFQALVEQTLNLSHNDKQQWLASVKAARPTQMGPFHSSTMSITTQLATPTATRNTYPPLTLDP